MVSSVSSDNSSILSYLLQAAQGSSQTNQASSTSLSSLLSSDSQSSGDTANISGPAQLFSELQQLATQNPTQFKQLTSEIASQLQTAAGSDSNSPLADLASLFETASETGSASGPQPPSGPQDVGTYDQQGQMISSSMQSARQSSGTDLQSLFQTISQEVSAALNN
jgi:hypothetical protein